MNPVRIEISFALLGIAVYVRTWIIVVCASTIVRIKPCGALTSLEHVNNVNCTCNIHVRYVMSFSFEKLRKGGGSLAMDNGSSALSLSELWLCSSLWPTGLLQGM